MFTFLVLALFVLVASAQDTTTPVPSSLPSTIPACLAQCITIAIPASDCTSFADLPCVCTSTSFQSAAQQCLQATCTPAEQQAALNLQNSQCASITGSGSGSGSATAPSTSAPASSSGTAPSSSSLSTTSPPSSRTSASSLSSLSSPASSTTSTGAASPNAARGTIIGSNPMAYSVAAFVGSLSAILGAALVL